MNGQGLEAFRELAGFKRWVPYRLVWNPKREKFDKIPHTGRHGLSTASPQDWFSLEEAAETAAGYGLSGVGIVLTGGVEYAGWTLVGFDYDKVSQDFKVPFKTYTERSPSKTGVRAFVWVPIPWAKRFKDTIIHPAHCDHCEVYLGTAPRFLTVTFDAIDDLPIAKLTDEALLKLEKMKLSPRELEKQTTTAPMGLGEPVDLKRFDLNPDQTHLVNGTGKVDRSAVLHGLIIKLIDDGVPQSDVLATICKTPALWRYCLEHRSDNSAKAAKFAAEEIDRAWPKSQTGMRQALIGFNRKWAGGGAPVTSPKNEDDFAPYISECWDDSLEIDWLIRDFLEDDVTALVWGPAGSYKTFLVLDVAVSVGSGIDWHRQKVERSGPVLYVCGEGRKGINRRIKALCQTRGLGRDVPIRVSKMPVLLSKSEQAKFLQDEIAKFDRPPVLIIVDTLARNFGGNENSAEDMGAFIDNVETIRRLCNATVLIIHHCGHDGSHARGSYALHAGVDIEYQAKPDKARKELVLENIKMKNAPEGALFYFQEEAVYLRNADGSVALDKEGQPITTIVMQTGSSRQADAVAAFFKVHPGLVGSGKSKYRERLPAVLQALHDNPGVPKRRLYEACGLKPGAGLDPLLEQMHHEGLLLDTTTLRLTEEGERAAETFGERADMRIAAEVAGKAERAALDRKVQGV